MASVNLLAGSLATLKHLCYVVNFTAAFAWFVPEKCLNIQKQVLVKEWPSVDAQSSALKFTVLLGSSCLRKCLQEIYRCVNTHTETWPLPSGRSMTLSPVYLAPSATLKTAHFDHSAFV